MNSAKDVAASVQLLMDANELNPTNLASKINEQQGDGTSSQVQIRRIVNRESKHPTDKTLIPIASYFGLRVTQLRDYDYVAKTVKDSGKMTTAKRQAINDILSILEDSSEADCLAVLQLVDRKSNAT